MAEFPTPTILGSSSNGRTSRLQRENARSIRVDSTHLADIPTKMRSHTAQMFAGWSGAVVQREDTAFAARGCVFESRQFH